MPTKVALIYSGNSEFKSKERRYHLVGLPIIATDLDTYSTMDVLGNLSSFIIAKECNVKLESTVKKTLTFRNFGFQR